MSVVERGEFELVVRFRSCAARLRNVAHLAPGNSVTPEYVEELASEFDGHAAALERLQEGA
jgi:hypothetical protein